MKPVRVLLACCAAAAWASAASAAVVEYTFRVFVTSGPLSETVWDGYFSYTNDGARGEPGIPLDMLTFEFNGGVYHHTDDVDYPFFPLAIIDDGVFQGIDYLVFPSDGDFQLVSFHIFGTQFLYTPSVRDDGPEGSLAGFVVYRLVPTPGGAALFGFGVLTAVRRRA